MKPYATTIYVVGDDRWMHRFKHMIIQAEPANFLLGEEKSLLLIKEEDISVDECDGMYKIALITSTDIIKQVHALAQKFSTLLFIIHTYNVDEDKKTLHKIADGLLSEIALDGHMLINMRFKLKNEYFEFTIT